jgi:hypothetical protein
MGARVSWRPRFFWGPGTLEGLKSIGGLGIPGAPLTFGGPGTLGGLKPLRAQELLGLRDACVPEDLRGPRYV